MLGLDPEEFCKPFNGGYTGKREVGRADKIKLREFLRSGIGYGYCVVHKVSSGIKTYTVDLPYLNNATQIQGVNVFYGGKTGTGKRVDIEVKTPKYVIKMNIRDSQGTDGYPTRIMGDFSYVQESNMAQKQTQQPQPTEEELKELKRQAEEGGF